MKITESKKGKVTVTFAPKDNTYFDGKLLSDGHFLIDTSISNVEIKFQDAHANSLYFQKKPFKADCGKIYEDMSLVPNLENIAKFFEDSAYHLGELTTILLDIQYTPRLILTEQGGKVWIQNEFSKLLKHCGVMTKDSCSCVFSEDKTVFVMPLNCTNFDAHALKYLLA